MRRLTILIISVFCLFLITSLSMSMGQSEAQQIDDKKCPSVAIKGPKKSKGIKTVSYKAQIKRLSDGARPIFKWSLVGAYIVEGEGSDLITVQPIARQIRVTLLVENFPVGCQSNNDSIVTEITHIPTMHPPPVVSSILTSVSSIKRPCPAGTKSDTCTPTSNEVQVSANATDPFSNGLFYTWAVTAGRLKGEGRTVIWDLSGVANGTYTITVEVGYFDLKATGSATVRVGDCADCKGPML